MQNLIKWANDIAAMDIKGIVGSYFCLITKNEWLSRIELRAHFR
jgi:hypothetical protein